MKVIYILLQCSWGILQTLIGLFVFLININCKHYNYHGAIVTEWNLQSSVSLGMFIFVTKKPYFYDKLKGKYSLENLSTRLLIHEYGHTIQSAILGPLYLIVMGIPSTLWGFLPAAQRKRQGGISYFSFFTERWANHLGELVTHEESMGDLLID